MSDALRRVDDGRPIHDAELPTSFTTNEDAFAAILALYARPGMVIADVTYGSGVFWKKADRSQYSVLASDLAPRALKADLFGEPSVLEADFRALPYANESVDMVVLDPPYRYTPAASRPQEHLDERYALRAASADITRVQGVVDLYEAGMREAHRVLRHGGFLVVKCQDTIQDGVQYRTRIELHHRALALGFADKDEAVMTVASVGRTRWPVQRHLRKTHSYFLVFRKGGAYPFGYRALQKR